MRPMQVGSGKRGPSFDEGSLDQYLRDISAYPLIDREAECSLARRIRDGDRLGVLSTWGRLSAYPWRSSMP